MPKLVTVYSPSGDAEQHTLPNARDLVQGANYKWQKEAESNPVAFAPATAVPTAEEKKRLDKQKIGQEIFDRFGTTAVTEKDADIPPVEDTPDEIPEEAAPEAQVEAAPVTLPRKPGRFGKN